MPSAIDSIVNNSNVQVPEAITAAQNSAKQKMDGEMFMQLLVAQLRAQDPSSPMDTNAMMTQTAQLASMEQLTSMSKLSQESFSLQMRVAASSLIGKEVGYVDADGKTQKGIATAVSFANAVPTVTIGDKSIRLDAISDVANAS
ncbi:MAG: flagellar hook capping protein [Micrococcales bacterium 70-64]|nr:flagellar hook capping protein [Leifsonia sp.]ODU64091.1 MAG: flagellar hook capping protein [Leifsonia sp. SCN 70-46]OJX85782.1 MAG: flagellar hook capping protein [Micrococcales bacterium 70-64]